MDIPVIDTTQDDAASWRDAEFAVFTTEQLMKALAQGCTVVLPDVDASVLDLPVGAGVDPASLSGEDNPIVSIECIGEEEVQCISVDDPDHLYLTDNLIPTHNTANIVFLKSTDDSMLETLEKMSGKTHQTYTDSKMVTRNEERMVLKNEGAVSYTRTTVEEPVISYNDLAFLPERNSIMFLASHPCVWNRNETILPMSWRLYGNHTIAQPGHDYSLQTIPTLSSAMDFDARQNQPDFEQMLERRLEQARYVKDAAESYKKAYGYSDYDVSRLDEDVYSDAIMDIVDERIQEKHKTTTKEATDEALRQQAQRAGHDAETNFEVKNSIAASESRQEQWEYARYAERQLSRASLKGIDSESGYNHQYDAALITAMTMIGEDALVKNADGKLTLWRNANGVFTGIGDATGNVPYIVKASTDHDDATAAARGARDARQRVMADTQARYVTADAINAAYGGYVVKDAFLDFLIGFEGDWNFGPMGNSYGKAVHTAMQNLGIVNQ